MERLSLAKHITDDLNSILETWDKLEVKSKQGDKRDKRDLSEERLDFLINKFGNSGKEVRSSYKTAYYPSQEIVNLVRKIADITGWNVRERGIFLYPQGGHMSWHTNIDCTGPRIYLSYSKNGNSQFLYRDPFTKKIIKDNDEPGWTARMFAVTARYPLWHAVSADEPRYSIGVGELIYENNIHRQ